MSDPKPYASMIDVVRRMAAAIGVVISLSVPLVYGLEAYVGLADHVRQAARLSAERIAQDATVRGEAWQVSGDRVAELIAGFVASVEMPRQIVTHVSGASVMDSGTPLSDFKISASSPIVVQNETTGSVRVEASLIPILSRLGLLFLLGIGIGGSAYLVTYRLPLKALRRINADLEQAQAELMTSHATLYEALRVMPDAFALFDASDRLTLFNRRYLAVHDLHEGEVTFGTTFEDILRRCVGRGHFADAVGREEAWIAERLAQHRSFNGVIEQELSDGRRLRIVERTTADGGRIGVLTDITSLKDSENERTILREQLHQSQRLEAIGKLTGGMAHDFNNYLGVIIGNLDMLGDHMVPAGRAYLESAMTAAEKSAQLTQSLLAYGRRQPLSPRRIDVSHNLATLAPLLRRTLGEDIVLSVDVALDIWPIRVDGAQLDSCIVNLADNGRDAMAQGGPLTISAWNVEIDEADARAIPDAVPGDYVLIEVSDGGVGMEPHIAAQAFEPFFSTKPAGHGTGLGLSTVYGFVKQSNGWVRIDSTVGRGTKVGLYLPRDGSAEHSDVASGAASAPAAQRAQTILIVEDNPMMRELAVEQLSSLGYHVIEAEHGAAALAILEQSDRSIDLLFTDVIMPGEIDGFELVRRARAIRPGVGALMTSGYPGDVPGKPRLTGVNLLAKPYRLADMRKAIRAALDARP